MERTPSFYCMNTGLSLQLALITGIIIGMVYGTATKNEDFLVIALFLAFMITPISMELIRLGNKNLQVAPTWLINTLLFVLTCTVLILSKIIV